MAQRWSGVLARLGTPTGDGRVLAPGGMSNRNLPMPLMWQEKTADGHGGAVTVGTIDEINYTDDMVTASGTFLENFPDKERVFELIRKGVVGPSVDLADDIEYEVLEDGTALITNAGIGGATLVPIEAFADVSIHMASDEGEMSASPAPVLVAAAALVLPSLDLFKNPQFDELTPFTVAPETGPFRKVFGHIAPWGVCHVGLPGCVTAPSSVAEYGYFMTGAEQTAEGVVVPVGKLTVGGGHAGPNDSFTAAIEHYDNEGTAVASVFAGEDEYGIWVAGYILPTATQEQVQALQRSPISGDWRSVGGNLELIAAHAVNVPGFPIPRARVSFSSGFQRSLVASFKVETPEPEPVIGETKDNHADAARARWAWSNRKKGR